MEGPLYQALKAQPENAINSEDIVSNDQIRQLLIFMGSITVISLILVIILLTILVLFIWYLRKLRNHNCRCSKSKSSSKELDMQIRNTEINYMESNISAGQPVKMASVHSETHQKLRGNKNVTVNPWSAVKVNQIAIDKSSQPVINKTFTTEDYTALAHLDTEDNCDNEPIYQEIKHSHVGGNSEGCDLEENKVNFFCKDEESGNIKSKKNEIIYWQITAKEVARFKPCTETFIERK
eukprot:TRINITY_DN24066_c0_g1_i3.p1 TRINITY_DN24066_c0_g1~~TRINITY_DN24066_c0_g1_i3.p1  ORF type:complete len:237 (-),score=31.85 TRINITY_DN24066_c0_g1_i3:14-724(-)